MLTGSCFDATVERLVAAGCVAAHEEAGVLVRAAPDQSTLDGWLTRRETGEPLPWITGGLTFCGREIAVHPGVYVPRFQTEDLARRAAALLPAGGGALDLCTGAGAIATHLRAEHRGALVIGLDRDPRSARCAQRNGVPTVVADVRSVPVPRCRFDVVTAVAPYVPTGSMPLLPADVLRHEPRLALDGGDDGLDLVREVIRAAGVALQPHGWLLVEVGGDQDTDLAPTFAAAGFDLVESWRDDEGDLRGIAARRVP